MSALLATLLTVPCLLASAQAPADPVLSFQRGVEAYRSGDVAAARDHWRETLDHDLDRLGRARVYLDLGNAHWRLDEPLEAIACYTAAVRLDPRLEAAWSNLELGRAKVNLPPADDGDLASTARRLLTVLRPDEQRTLLLAALVLWTLVLTFEVRIGGARGRAALLVATALLVLAALPWAHARLAPRNDAPMLVVADSSVSMRSEPLESRVPIGELTRLEEVERIDALPGWERVERADGVRGWVREDVLFALRLGG